MTQGLMKAIMFNMFLLKRSAFYKIKTISISRYIFTQADYCIVGREGRKDSVQIANSIIKRWVFVKLKVEEGNTVHVRNIRKYVYDNNLHVNPIFFATIGSQRRETPTPK